MKIINHYLKNVVLIDLPADNKIWPATVNYRPKLSVYEERLLTDPDTNIEYRIWDPFRSKLSACILENMKGIPKNLNEMRILYLGASTGTTVSHVSDIVANSGKVYALEFSVRSSRRLIQLSQQRQNIIPIVADARYPDQYSSQVIQADFIFQDVSQPNLSQIFVENVLTFLKPNGKAILIIKAHSIDSTRSVESVAAEQIEYLEDNHLTILEILEISTFEKSHRAILIEKK